MESLKCPKLCKAIIIIAVLFIILIGIPASLNCLLQKESSLKSIIGGSESPRVWLLFWGSYLAAIGTVFLSIVSFFNNYKVRKKDNIQTRLDRLLSNYNTIENEIKHLSNLHSIFKLTDIVKKYRNEKLEGESRLNLYMQQLREALLIAEKYNDFSIESTFLQSFRGVNEFYADKAIQLSELVYCDLDSDNKNNKLEELLIGVYKDKQRQLLEYKFEEQYRALLQAKRTEIINIQKLLEKESLKYF